MKCFGRVIPAAWRVRLNALSLVGISLSIPIACTCPAPAAEARQTLRIAAGGPAPMVSFRAMGKPTGFIIHAVGEAARRRGFAVEWRFSGSPDADTEALRQGEIDMVAATSTTEREREF